MLRCRVCKEKNCLCHKPVEEECVDNFGHVFSNVTLICCKCNKDLSRTPDSKYTEVKIQMERIGKLAQDKMYAPPDTIIKCGYGGCVLEKNHEGPHNQYSKSKGWPPQQENIEWEEEFNERFMKYQSLRDGSYFIPAIKSFIKSLLEKEREKAAHKTEDGYCCACDYDITQLRSLITEARAEGFHRGQVLGEAKGKDELLADLRKELVEKIEGMKDNREGCKNGYCEYDNCEHYGYNQALYDIINLLKKND